MQSQTITGSISHPRCARAPASLPRMRFQLFTLVLLGVLLSLCCTSCTDLTEVAKFAACGKTASTGYSDIVDDFAGSATRRSFYVREKEKPEVLIQVQKYKEQEPAMKAALKPLTDYLAALAAISTDSADSKGKDAAPDPSASDLEKLGMSSKQATATLGLAGKIGAALTKGYRSDKAGKAIHDCNPDLQDYLEGLEHIVGTNYPETLNDERIAANQYYSDLLDKYGDKEPLASTLLMRQKQMDLDGIAKREQAAKAYVKILTDIGQGHQKLFDAGENITTKELVSIVEPQVSDIVKQSITVAKAF